jgi:hypothetical protein
MCDAPTAVGRNTYPMGEQQMVIKSMSRAASLIIAAVNVLGVLAITACASTSSSGSAAPTASATPPAVASSSSAAVSTDGLTLVRSTSTSRVYVRPGASLKPYTKFAILTCYVSFAPQWREDMQTNFNIPITEDQMKQTQAQIASEFRDVFVTQLEQGGFPLVDTAAPNVLVLRPALVNVYIAAPQNMEDPNEQTFGTTAGQLTLYLELYDSVTNELLARVIDAESASIADGLFTWQTRAGNITAGREVMTTWADTLRQHMEAAQGAQ